jgi:sulfatase modifying factor 1
MRTRPRFNAGIILFLLFCTAPFLYAQKKAEEVPKGMVWIRGGEFTQGCDAIYARPEEQPAHTVKVSGFYMDVTEVTNEQFAQFVHATGYITTAERAPTMGEIMSQLPPGTPQPDSALLVPGSMVFKMSDSRLRSDDYTQWWFWVPGASWQHPEGPGSDIVGKEHHPVVQVSWDDALAYASWAGKRLPTEAEWEFAAKGGLKNKKFSWGDEEPEGKKQRANIWHGSFPDSNSADDGYVLTAPVRSYPPNGFGLYDMAGNVWEWCNDWFDDEYYKSLSEKVSVDPQGSDHSYDRAEPYTTKRIQKGGSFLCHISYCERYRPSARQQSTHDSGMSHVGFRCVMSKDASDKNRVK